jgi:hypothetical protein
MCRQDLEWIAHPEAIHIKRVIAYAETVPKRGSGKSPGIDPDKSLHVCRVPSLDSPSASGVARTVLSLRRADKFVGERLSVLP